MTAARHKLDVEEHAKDHNCVVVDVKERHLIVLLTEDEEDLTTEPLENLSIL